MKKNFRFRWLLAFIAIGSLHFPVQADESILIAAASNLRFTMNEMCKSFQEEHPSIQTKVSYGSSGNFFAQIKQGAPYDIFFSAEATYPALLREDGFTGNGEQKVYAVGKIVLWIPKGSTVDPSKGLKIILASEIRKLAIANPQHAPYGRAAEESLRYYGLWNKVKEKLIFGEDISQAANFVHTGAADAGIIALSLALSSKLRDHGRYWIIPVDSHNAIEQVYTVLKRGEGKQSIKIFLDFFHGERGKNILTQYGFVLP